MKLICSGALALALVASGARADVPADLPLDQVTAPLHAAGVDAAWSVAQWPSDQDPGLWGVEAYSGRNEPTPGVCATKYTQIGVSERNGQFFLVEKSASRTQYAFSKCRLSFAKDFYDVVGPSDVATLRRLRKDMDTIDTALNGSPPVSVKVTFRDDESRKLFPANIRESDIESVYSNEDGHSRFCFFTRGRDVLGAPETLGIEVVSGKMTELKVDICGVIDVARVKK